MTDNFKLFKFFIETRCPCFDENQDLYYVIELVRRKKDNPDLTNMHFKNYYINKISDLDKYRPEIVLLCKELRLRAYFSVNCKSYKKVMLKTLAEYARRISEDSYLKPYNIYESCSGTNHVDKVWIIDIDEDFDLSDLFTIKSIINKFDNSLFITTIPTKNGVHILTKPFDRIKFKKECLERFNKVPEIKTNHLSLLFEIL